MMDKSGFKFNRVISPETKYMHLMEAVAKLNLDFCWLGLKVKRSRFLEKVNLRFQVKGGK